MNKKEIYKDESGKVLPNLIKNPKNAEEIAYNKQIKWLRDISRSKKYKLWISYISGLFSFKKEGNITVRGESFTEVNYTPEEYMNQLKEGIELEEECKNITWDV